MHRPALRVPRLGFALVFLPVFLGSASGAPALGHAASGGQPTTSPLRAAPLSSDQPEMITVIIPCIYGSCQVRVYAPGPDERMNPLLGQR